MWSDKKYVDYIINTLLFLFSLNFLYIGQLLLPLICLILFIDNKFKFHVKNIKMFVLLCLFSITYCIFSIDLGYYCLISLCIPMAYYIGSNLKDKSKYKYVIYILTFAMATHLILNMFYELIAHCNFDFYDLLTKHYRYDIWRLCQTNTTLSALNFVFFIGSIYYIVLYEESKKIKIIAIVLFILSGLYTFMLGRRTTLLLSSLAIAASLFLNFFIFNKDKNNLIKMIKPLLIVFILFTILVVMFIFNIFNFKNTLMQTSLFYKLFHQGLSNGRLEIFMNALKIIPKHLWGGREILDITGSYIHDLWFDIYDYAGIVPFVLMLVITFVVVKKYICIFKNKNINYKEKLLIMVWALCTSINMFLEPLMSGGTIFLFSVAIVISVIDNALL